MNHANYDSMDLLVTATGIMINRSMYRNCDQCQKEVDKKRPAPTSKSPNDDAKEYSKVIVVNCMREYSALWDGD
jgi:hypothetical protein